MTKTFKIIFKIHCLSFCDFFPKIDQILVLEEDNVKCLVCKSRMFLPYEYIADPRNKDVALCDDCLVLCKLILSSGHENCDLPGCQECLRLGQKIRDRCEVTMDFVSGTIWANPWDYTFDDGGEDFNSEGADDEDETNDILDDFDGGEIELMFTQDYEEDMEGEKRN